MALQSSGQISTADLVAEFGGSAPFITSNYYRGGSLVDDVTENAGVPASGQTSSSDFYGARDNYVNLVNHSISAVKLGPGGASASIRYRPSGLYGIGPTTVDFTVEGFGTGDTVTGDSGADSGSDSGNDYYDTNDWINNHDTTGGVGAADYEIRATLSTGDTPSGTLATWLALTTDREWTLSALSGQTKTCNLLIEIRDASTTTVLDSCTITLSAEVT